MKLNRKLVLILSLVLSLALATGGTLAYLSDTDADVNTMTLGNVKIEQHEYERVEDENGGWVSTNETDKYGYTPDEITDFTQRKPLYPAVFADGDIKWDDRNGSQNASGADSHQQSWGQIDAPGSNQLFDDSVKNVIDKFVFVENTGKSEAYVRTWIALEQGSVAAEDFKKIIMTNSDDDHWAWEVVATDVEIDNNEYYVLLATYLGPKSNPTGILAPGAYTYPSLLQVYMRPEATNEDVEAIDGNNNGTYDILVVSQAIQTAGFPNAEVALTEGFGAASKDSHPWIDIDDPDNENDQDPDGEIEWPKEPAVGDDENVTYPIPDEAYRVTSAEELADAVAAGKTMLRLAPGEYDISGCKGKNLTLIGEDLEETVIKVVGAGSGEANGQLDYGFDGSTVTFQNLTITTNNATYAGYARMKGTYQNVNFMNCYCLNSDSVFEYCTFDVSGDQYNLWTWGAPTATFTNCTFNSDGKAVLLYGTANTVLTLNNCLFNDTGVLPDLKAAVEIGNDYGKSYELIVNNTVVNGYEINNKGTNTGTTLWGNKNSMGTDKLNVVVDGVDVY